MNFPDILKPNDKIALFAPAGSIHYPEDIEKGIETLVDWGLFVVEGYTVSLQHHQFAGSDEQRLADLQYLLDNPEIKAILAVRGGYGCSRIIDRVDFTQFLRHPKWIIGFSDLTLLLHHVHNLGYATIHGPMAKHLGTKGSESATESLQQILFGHATEYKVGAHPANRGGRTHGELLGGNLCLLSHALGSASEVDTRGKILFLEDVGEPLYNLDRMMWQIRRAGKLDQLAGLLVGQFSEIKGSRENFGQDAYEIIADHVRHFDYPVAYDFPIGHVTDNQPIVVGAMGELNVDANGTTLHFTSRR
jgi:muramoyltetrapeptide carboxypeptidase